MKLLGLLLSVLFASVPLQAGAASMAGESTLDVSNQTPFYLVMTIYQMPSEGNHSTTWCIFPEKNAVHKAPFTVRDVLFQVRRTCGDANHYASRMMPYQSKYTVTKVKNGYIFR